MGANDLAGSVIAVTGAAGRLGGRMVRRLAAEGAVVAAVDRDPSRLPEDLPARLFGADVTSEADVVACFRRIGEELGGLDALVHTVGMWEGRPLLETSLEAWDRVLRVNLNSAFLCFREAARLMQQRGGRLIGIASGQGADRGRAEQGGYSAAKAGVVRLVEAVAEEFKGTGVTAHALAPSFILFGDEAADARGVPASDLIDLACYLCGPAGASLNGATLRAYGTLR